jgi:arginase
MMDSSKTAHILGVPMDLGQQRRGVDMGPSAVRYAGLAEELRKLGYSVTDGGNVRVPIAEQIDHDPTDGTAHNATAIGHICSEVYRTMCEALSRDQLAIALGGDHSTALGTIAAALEQPGRLGVLWIDAHADFNTPETTLTGNVHGMVVAALMGQCPPSLTVGETRLQSHQVVMLALRDLDPAERMRLREQGIATLTMSDIDKMGMKEAAESALRLLTGATRLHISLDLDSLDPSLAPGVGTPVPGGLSYREAHLLMEMLADDGRVRSVDVVEVNPILDDKNKTALIAVELVASLLGKRIL